MDSVEAVDESTIKEDAVAASQPISDEENMRRMALEKLEGASKDSLLGQGLKMLDDSVENLTSGAWFALGNVWKGSVNLVQKLEQTTLQQGGAIAPGLIQTGKDLTAKGLRVLEYVGRETMEILAAEIGVELEKDEKDTEVAAVGRGERFIEDVTFEDVTFDRCFYVYGGPEHLEELESLSNHYTLMCNRARAKLSGEERTSFEGLLKNLLQVLTTTGEGDEVSPTAGKDKKVVDAINGIEMKTLRESSVSKAADMAAGFTATLGGLAMTEVVQKTTDRLEAIKVEGVHRVSELCALCVAHLLLLGKLVLLTTSGESEEVKEGIDWPEDCLGKAHVIKARAQLMAGDIEMVSKSFMTGIGDVTAAFQAAIKSEVLNSNEGEEGDVRQGLLQESSIEVRAQDVSSDLDNAASLAVEKVQDGLQFLLYVVLSTSLKS